MQEPYEPLGGSVPPENQFHARVRALIAIENSGGGLGHFSKSTLDRHGISELNLSDLSEVDESLLNFYKATLVDIKGHLERDEGFPDEYVNHLKAEVVARAPFGETPTQEIVRACIRNKFAALTGYLSIYRDIRRDVAIDIVKKNLLDIVHTYINVV